MRPVQTLKQRPLALLHIIGVFYSTYRENVSESFTKFSNINTRLRCAQKSRFNQTLPPATALYTTRRNIEDRSTEARNSTTYHPDQKNDQSGAREGLGRNIVMEWISCCHQGGCGV
jgi:hypothetical protein